MPIRFDSSLTSSPLSREPPAQVQRTGPAEARAFATVLSTREHASAQAAPRLVAAERTRLSGDEAARALSSAWKQARGRAPSERTLAVLVGQWAHETGRGASMLNFNFGGIKGTGPSGMSAAYGTREGSGANEIRITDRFRAYASAEEGAADYVSLLARRYPEAVDAAERGDAAGFVHALKARGYFTGDEADYTASVTSLARSALASGFGALGAAAPALDRPAAAVASAEARALDTSGAQTAAPWMSMPASGVFVDEVVRAALSMSALRIGEGAAPRNEDREPAGSAGRRYG